MNNKDALIKTIVSSPHTIGNWLVYSDYLQTQEILEGEYLTLFFKLQTLEKEAWWGLSSELNQLVSTHWDQFNKAHWPCFNEEILDHISTPKMQLIPMGKFLMGSLTQEEGHKTHERAHKVVFERAFAMSQYPITLAQYDVFCKHTHKDLLLPSVLKREFYPVIDITWHDAFIYCEWLNQYTQYHYRLPTEAEWEYACRAGTNMPFWWGNEISFDKANYDTRYSYNKSVKKNHTEDISFVNKFYPNPWQLYQMHGNVWEWTGSYYDERYHGEELRLADERNYTIFRSVRGGSSVNPPEWLRAAFRYSASPSNKDAFIGFRIMAEL